MTGNDERDVQEELRRCVKAVQSGDLSAFSRLVDLTHPRLLRFALLLCRNRERADDLCQETFLKALESIQTVKEGTTFASWLLKVMKNLFLDSTRSGLTRYEYGVEDLEEVFTEGTTGESLDRVLQVQDALSVLPEDERIAMLLVHLEGYSYLEAAEVCEVTEDTVRARLRRARKKFIEKFESSGTKSGSGSSSTGRL